VSVALGPAASFLAKIFFAFIFHGTQKLMAQKSAIIMAQRRGDKGGERACVFWGR